MASFIWIGPERPVHRSCVDELEKDLSLKQQFLDVVLLRRGTGEFDGRFSERLEALTDHNFLSYKSLHEPLDDWSLKELSGHYVNYRKQAVDEAGELVTENRFQMFGVSTRFPQKLAGQVSLRLLRPGVYETVWGTDKIRVIVLNEISREEYNSWWHLFSNVPEAIQYGATHLRQRTTDTSTILIRLFENYKIEGITMPYTIQDFRREFTLEHLNLLSANERLEGLSPEKRLEGVTPDKRLEGVSPEMRLEGLSPEIRIEGLSPAELKRLVQEAQRKLDSGSGDSSSNETA